MPFQSCVKSFQNDEKYSNLLRESVLTLVCEEDGSDLYGGGEAGGEGGEGGDEGARGRAGQREAAHVDEVQVPSSVLFEAAHLHLGPALLLRRIRD
jgi:hypothetical protein